MTIDVDSKDPRLEPARAPDDQAAELAALRAIVQNLLLEVARETGAERLKDIREGALNAISAQDTAQDARDQSAAIVQATFDTVAAAAGFTVNGASRGLH